MPSKPLFQSEAKCDIIMQIELFFTRTVLHLGPVYMEVGDPR